MVKRSSINVWLTQLLRTIPQKIYILLYNRTCINTVNGIIIEFNTRKNQLLSEHFPNQPLLFTESPA